MPRMTGARFIAETLRGEYLAWRRERWQTTEYAVIPPGLLERMAEAVARLSAESGAAPDADGRETARQIVQGARTARCGSRR